MAKQKKETNQPQKNKGFIVEHSVFFNGKLYKPGTSLTSAEAKGFPEQYLKK